MVPAAVRASVRLGAGADISSALTGGFWMENPPGASTRTKESGSESGIAPPAVSRLGSSACGLKPAGAVALCRLLRRSRRSGVGPGGPVGSSRRMSRSIAGGSDGLAGSPTITRARLESDHE